MPKISFFLNLLLTLALLNPLTVNAQTDKPAGEARGPEIFDSATPWVARIKDKGQLKVGFDTFKPWAMMDKQGQYIGFEIDVARRLASDLGVELKLVPTSWDGIIPALVNNKFDILIGGMGITEERAQKVAFTAPYEYSGIALVASKAKAHGFSTQEDFNNPEVIIVAKLGTTAATAGKKLFPKATLLLFNDEGQTAQEIKNGRAHALLATAPFPAELANKDSANLFLPIAGLLTQEPCGMALSPKDKDALPELNLWIEKVKSEGWLNERWAYWFEGLEWEKELK